MVSRAALDCKGYDISRFIFRLVLELLLIIEDFNGFFMRELILELLEQIFLRLLGRIAGNAFQHFKLALLDHFGLVELFFRRF